MYAATFPIPPKLLTKPKDDLELERDARMAKNKQAIRESKQALREYHQAVLNYRLSVFKLFILVILLIASAVHLYMNCLTIRSLSVFVIALCVAG